MAINSSALVTFLSSDKRFTWRSVSAIKRHFSGSSTDEILATVQSDTASFLTRIGPKQGLLVAAANGAYSGPVDFGAED